MRKQNKAFFVIQDIWKDLRLFAFENRTIFETLFVIIVLTTFALHKTIMDSRIKILENNINGLDAQRAVLLNEYGIVCENYKDLLNRFENPESNGLNSCRTINVREKLK